MLCGCYTRQNLFANAPSSKLQDFVSHQDIVKCVLFLMLPA